MVTQSELIEATGKYLIPNYGPRLLAVARGEGCRLWDLDGKEYVDFFAGFGAGGVAGHCHLSADVFPRPCPRAPEHRHPETGDIQLGRRHDGL